MNLVELVSFFLQETSIFSPIQLLFQSFINNFNIPYSQWSILQKLTRIKSPLNPFSFFPCWVLCLFFPVWNILKVFLQRDGEAFPSFEADHNWFVCMTALGLVESNRFKAPHHIEISINVSSSEGKNVGDVPGGLRAHPVKSPTKPTIVRLHRENPP